MFVYLDFFVYLCNMEKLTQIDRIHRLRLSCTINDNGVERHFHNGFEYVDLGLPSGTLWAKCNLGAEKETDNGLYFAWGETKGYKDARGDKKFTWNDYKFERELTKYNDTDEKVNLDAIDDAAHVNMGGNWRIPTNDDFKELVENTVNEWTEVDGVKGYKFINKYDKSKWVFLLAASFCDNSRLGSGSSGCYWSSSLYSSNVMDAYCMVFNSLTVAWQFDYSRRYGFSVRGVITP